MRTAYDIITFVLYVTVNPNTKKEMSDLLHFFLIANIVLQYCFGLL